MDTKNVVFIVCLIISYSDLCWGQTRYVFMPGKVRTLPTGVTIPPGMPWSGSETEVRPKIPGVKADFDSVQIMTTHGATCADYRNEDRGTYRRPDGTVHFYYPWTHYVKNCDISRFLYCESGSCKCFPGYYWRGAPETDPNGRCVAGYLQSCTTFKAYDFQIDPICGEGMECANNTDPRGVAKHCICYQKQAGRSFLGPAVDTFGNAKYYCAMSPSLSAGGGSGTTCSEFRGRQWVTDKPSAPVGMGRFKTEFVTKTGCGDIGTVVENVFCRFPNDQTGPTPSIPYGQRQNGTCSCTDRKLSYLAGRGCFPRVRQACKDGMVEYMGRKPGDKMITAMKGDCGPYAMCSGAGVCVCKTDTSGNSFKTMGGQCSPNATDDGDEGKGQLIGSNCSDSNPCYKRGGQRCGKATNTCECRPLYFEGMEKQCQGLYGVPCDDVSGCVDGGGFECTAVPELKSVKPSVRKDQKYCVCKHSYLNTMTGRCGAETLMPTQMGILVLVVIFLQRIPKMTN